MNAPRSGSASMTSTCSGSPKTTSPAANRPLSERRTSSRCSRLASAPMRTDGFEGLPTTTLARRSDAASPTASSSVSGTIARRMAVHFWPALTVISVISCLTNKSNSGVRGCASGPRTEQLRESASAFNRTERANTVGLVCGGAGGLDDAGDSRKEGRRKLFQRSPDREVERVDLDGDAAQRGQDVLPDELPSLAELLDLAFNKDPVVRK